MARNVTYQIYDAATQEWVICHLLTSVNQVGESNARVFLRPQTHKVNGLSFYDKDTKIHSGITLYADNISLSSNDATTVTGKLGSLDSQVQANLSSINNLAELLGDQEGGLQYQINTLNSLVQANTQSITTLATTYASEDQAGLMSPLDKSHLDSMYKIWTSSEDGDDFVNKIEEILGVFENYPEGDNLIELLASKADKSTVEAMDTRLAATQNTANTALQTSDRAEQTADLAYEKAEDNATDIKSLDTRLTAAQNEVSSYRQMIDEANQNAEYALEKVDGIHQVFLGSTEPTSPKAGDIWLQY